MSRRQYLSFDFLNNQFPRMETGKNWDLPFTVFNDFRFEQFLIPRIYV